MGGIGEQEPVAGRIPHKFNRFPDIHNCQKRYNRTRFTPAPIHLECNLFETLAGAHTGFLRSMELKRLMDSELYNRAELIQQRVSQMRDSL
ncbi:MAG: hypothetical protein ACK57U_12830 [Planctomycetota bacterium]